MNLIAEEEQINQISHLQALLDEKEYDKLAEELSLLPEVEAAEFLSKFDDHEAILIFKKFIPEFQADVFAKFDRYVQLNLVNFFSTRELAHLLTNMPPD